MAFAGTPIMGGFSGAPIMGGFSGAPVMGAPISSGAPIMGAPIMGAPIMGGIPISTTAPSNAPEELPGDKLTPQECAQYGVPYGAVWGAVTSSGELEPEDDVRGTRV